MKTRLPSSRPRVVCVADEHGRLAALERVAREVCSDVFPTGDPEEALQWLRSCEVGVFLSDYRMPAMSGTALLEQARRISPSTALILVTGFAGERDILKGRKAGLFTVFPKPWDDRELKRKIREHLRDRELEGRFVRTEAIPIHQENAFVDPSPELWPFRFPELSPSSLTG